MDENAEIVREMRSLSFYLVTGLTIALLVFRPYDAARSTIPIPPWSLHCAEGNIARVTQLSSNPDHVRVEIFRWATRSPWEVVARKRVSVARGRQYALRFEARAEAGRTVGCGVREFHPPWTSIGPHREIEVNRDWRSFHFELDANKGSDNAVLEFHLGNSPVTVEIRDARLVPTHKEPSRPPTTYEGETKP